MTHFPAIRVIEQVMIRSPLAVVWNLFYPGKMGVIVMRNVNNETVVAAYENFLNDKTFPCVAAKAALAKNQVHCFVADHMACPKDDAAILAFLYDFVDSYRQADTPFHSAAIIFKGPEAPGEAAFEMLLWQRLQVLSDMDALQYGYDHRVSKEPSSPEFSFSLKGEAFFIVGLHPDSSRTARQFAFPALVFNPHAEFERLRTTRTYGKMKDIVRKKDIAYSGSINPMLTDFGTASDLHQYSGRQHSSEWQCPLKINHERTEYYTAP